MAAPTNISAATAAEITVPLPYSISQDVSEAAGPNYEVWYTYTGRVGDALVISFRFTALTSAAYDPVVDTYTGTPSSLTQDFNFSSITHRPFELPITPGVNYYFKITDNVVPDSPLLVTVIQGPREAVPVGSLLITDFGSLVPASTIDNPSADILQFVDIPASDFGDQRANGILGFINGDAPYVVSLYEPTTLELIAAVAGLTLSSSGNQIRKCDALGGFFVAKSATSTSATVYVIGDDGTVSGTTWTLPANSRNIKGMTADLAGETLYYSQLGGTGAIHAYDLLGNAPLADFVALVAGYSIGKDALTLADGTYLFMYKDNTTSPRDDMVLHYDAAGMLLDTYNIPTNENLDRIQVALDDPLSFWTWTFVTAAGTTICRFTNILIADGSTIVTFDTPQFAAGINTGQPVADSMERFGVSNSCPLIILSAEILAPPSPPEAGSGIYVLDVNKHHDTLYTGYDPVTTENVRIPTPMAKFAYLGDE